MASPILLSYANPADADSDAALLTQNGTVLIVAPANSEGGITVPEQFQAQQVTGPASAVAIPAGTLMMCNTSGGAISLVPPQGLSSSAYGTWFGVVDDHDNAGTTPITVGNGTTDVIEDPTRPGHFFSSVLVVQNAQSTAWFWSPEGWKVLWCSPPATQAGELSFANIAALEAYENVNLPAGAQAYVRTVGAYWAYQPSGIVLPDGITVVNAANGGQWWRTITAVAESAQQQVPWFVDPQNVEGSSSDENDGTTSGTALRTKAEIIRRWGTKSPTFNGSNVVITYLSADTTGNDPGLFAPYFVNSATLTHTAPLPTASFTGSLLAVTAKNRAGNTALRSTFTTTTGAIVANMLLVNSTRGNSRAFVQRNVSGGTWQISQPFTPYSGTGAPANTEVDTWANGDAITGYVLSNVDLALVGGQSVEATSTLAPSHIVWQLNIWDPQSLSFVSDPVVANGTSMLCIVESVCTRALSWSGAMTPSKGQFANSVSQVEMAVSGVGGFAFGPLINGGILNGIASLDSCEFQFDTIVACIATAFTNTLVNSSMCVDSGTVAFYGATQISLNAVVYGAGKLNVVNGVVRYSSSAVSSFPLSGGLAINAATNAYSNSTTAGLTTVHLLALSPANLDAAAGAAGFGGLAYVPGVAAFQSGTTTP